MSSSWYFILLGAGKKNRSLAGDRLFTYDKARGNEILFPGGIFIFDRVRKKGDYLSGVE